MSSYGSVICLSGTSIAVMRTGEGDLGEFADILFLESFSSFKERRAYLNY